MSAPTSSGVGISIFPRPLLLVILSAISTSLASCCFSSFSRNEVRLLIGSSCSPGYRRGIAGVAGAAASSSGVSMNRFGSPFEKINEDVLTETHGVGEISLAGADLRNPLYEIDEIVIVR